MLKRLISLTLALLWLCGLCVAFAAEESPYFVEVDITNQITTVYRASDRAIVRQMICSTGTGTKTPLGTFRLETPRASGDREPWYYIGKYACYVKYVTRIKGSILFHSIPYSDKEMSAIDTEALAQLGTKASHGCIRLRWEDAEWIAENCPAGTVVTIYNGAAKKEALRQLLMDEGYVQGDGKTYGQFLETARGGDSAFGVGRGARGEDVTALQKQLVGLGFMSGDVTGVYDDATVVAVMRYQSAAGLTVNGVANGALAERIMTEDEAVAEYATLTPGCSGTLVSRFQRALRELGFYDGEIDGVYNSGLSNAMASFRSCMGLGEASDISPADREVAYQLLDRLDGRYGRGGYALHYTEGGDSARVRRDTPLYATADASGERVTELPAGTVVQLTGRVGRWRKVEYGGWTGYLPAGRLGDFTESGPSAHWGRSVDRLGESEMKSGDMGDGVLALQERLLELGFFTGEISPIYSLATARAVEDYQRAAGLEITGIASPEFQRDIASSDEVNAFDVEAPVIAGCVTVSQDSGDDIECIVIEDDPPRPAWLRSRPVGV